MLERIGTDSLDELYNDVPEKFLYKGEYDLRNSMSEQEVREYFECLDKKNPRLKVFVGAGAYDHYSPAVVRYIISLLIRRKFHRVRSDIFLNIRVWCVNLLVWMSARLQCMTGLQQLPRP